MPPTLKMTKPYPSTILLKEKVLCPGCGHRVALRTLKFKHTCPKPATEAQLEAKRVRMLQSAEEALAKRLGQRGACVQLAQAASEKISH